MLRPRFTPINPNTIVLIRHFVVGVLACALVSLLVSGVWYGTRLPFFTVTTITINGGETIDHALVRTAVEQTLEGTYVGIIPRRFAWLYPQQEVVEAIQRVPRVDAVAVSRISGTEVAVVFTEHIPTALWCADVATSTCLFLNEDGYAFAPSPILAGGTMTRYVALGAVPTVGVSPFASSSFAHAETAATLLAEHGWFVSHVEIDQVQDAFFHIVGGGEFKLSLSQPVVKSIDNLLTVLQSDEFADVAPGTFQYIDVRFGDRVFVNEAPVQLDIATTTATTS
jgi:cell division septal protein FtsQ